VTPLGIEVFRIVTRARAADAFTGEGARRYGGRWNPKGLRVVYTASTRSLAMLEMLVQDQPLRAEYVIIAVRIPPSIRVDGVASSALPSDWRSPRQSEYLRRSGTEWLERADTAVLRVPSAVVPQESNYLLNPAHADFGKIKYGKPETFIPDDRLIARFGGVGDR
jgi:RES domain-containing protein